jgi:hypothetical protein
MMILRLFKVLVILAIAALASGCKLAVISSRSGDITSHNADLNCPKGIICEIKLPAGFTETFTTTAKPGFQFVKWQKGEGFLCGDSTNV